MKWDVKQQWVAKLRAEGDRQCKGAFFTDSGGVSKVCALGALIEVANTPEQHGLTLTPFGLDPELDHVNQFGQFGTEKDFWLDRYTQDHIAEMNDSGATFDQIAKWIEVNVEADQ